MDDGNVIVAAGRDPISLFKCHQSILSKQSEVFRGKGSAIIASGRRVGRS